MLRITPSTDSILGSLKLLLCLMISATAASPDTNHPASTPNDPVKTIWTMLNVTPVYWQADCHLLELPDGSRILIDAAEAKDAPPVVLPYLKSRGIDRLDLVIISHFHWDHYGSLSTLIAAGIKIGRVAGNLPAARELADREAPWGMDWDEVQRLLQLLKESNIPYFTPAAGDRLVDMQTPTGGPICLEVLCAYDGINTPVGKTWINDTSIVLRFTHGRIRALFTGDLDRQLGTWLARSNVDVSADILKVPHHGGEGHPPNDFYDKVSPRAALVSVSKQLWTEPRCARMRSYLIERAIPTYLTGIDGHVTVEMHDGGFSISTEATFRTESYIAHPREEPRNTNANRHTPTH